jgi:hypothetical protein
MASPIWHSVIVFQILKILTTDWEDQEAFKLGIIDKDGNALKRRKDLTSKEREAYTLLHIFVFNLKRIMNKLSIRSKLASYTAALFLTKEFVKEQVGYEQAELLEREVWRHIKEQGFIKPTDLINESLEMYDMPRVVYPGTYIKEDTGEYIEIEEELQPIGQCLGIDVFRHDGFTFAQTDIKEVD